MKEKYYFTDDIAIINFDLAWEETKSGLLKSDGFADIAMQFLGFLNENNPDLYDWAVRGKDKKQAVKDIVDVARMAIVFTLDEIENPYLDDAEMFLEFVEEFFDFWKDHQRYSVTTVTGETESTSFVNQDSTFNHLVRNTFRTLEQRLMGRRTQVFRQQPSGTNGAIAVYQHGETGLSDRYAFLENVMFIDSIMMRTPMILHPKSNKREGMFEEVVKNPAYTFAGDPEDYFCYPAKVGSLMIFICFHKDYISSGVPCANLFEIATREEAAAKPDGIVIFGNPDGEGKCTFYHDRDEEVWVGSVSSSEKIEYFGYMKKMVLTIHNAIMMQRGWLPIHGAFINITMKNGVKKGICLMGDSGAGKSETIEALKALGKDKIRKMEIVFDDMGTFHIEDGVVYAQGTETGAFVRLDDLDPGAPYRDMNRSIFFNPDKHNARVITPAAPYQVIVKNSPVDLFAYANNYDDKTGLNRFETIEDAKDVFIRGRRMAKGTTQEVGLSETYFANPFGPMQKQDLCGPIIDEVFSKLEENGTFIGEVYTHLGLNPDGDDIGIAAEALLDFIEAE
ncbi:MAG: hypothetical protein PUD55_03660 [Firmicutes bacterium]|nr:hypothetical protein [Bacillota bacterium]